MAVKEKEKETRITKEFLLKQLNEDELDLSMCNLSAIPVRELAKVPRGTKLDLSHNRLTSLPDDFCSLKHIVELDVSRNQLTELPANFGQLCNLQKLILDSNHLTALPLSFSQLKKLKWLDLKGNQLDPELTEAVGHCQNEQECKQCAAKVMSLMKKRASDEEREKQRKLAAERERRKKEEEQLKREQEKQRALRQRQRTLAAQQRKEMEERKREEEEEEEEEEDEPEPPVQSNQPSRMSSWLLRCVLFLPLVVIIACFGLVAFGMLEIDNS